MNYLDLTFSCFFFLISVSSNVKKQMESTSVDLSNKNVKK